MLAALAGRDGVGAEAVARALVHVQDARALAAGNVNPQLILASTLAAIRRELSRGS
jgi:hypothetical protein